MEQVQEKRNLMCMLTESSIGNHAYTIMIENKIISMKV